MRSQRVVSELIGLIYDAAADPTCAAQTQLPDTPAANQCAAWLETFNRGARDAREFFATSEQVSYDVTKDGQRFLINTQVKNADIQPMSIVLNWDADMNKK